MQGPGLPLPPPSRGAPKVMPPAAGGSVVSLTRNGTGHRPAPTHGPPAFPRCRQGPRVGVVLLLDPRRAKESPWASGRRGAPSSPVAGTPVWRGPVGRPRGAGRHLRPGAAGEQSGGRALRRQLFLETGVLEPAQRPGVCVGCRRSLCTLLHTCGTPGVAATSSGGVTGPLPRPLMVPS